TFSTADGVVLRGLFYKAVQNSSTAPVGILMYPPGQRNAETDMTKGDWEGLTRRLNQEGYNVFRFDWRGHGKRGHEIKDRELFWSNRFSGPWNVKYVTGYGKKPLKNDIYFKDIRDPLRYMPVYLLDLAAVRAHLDSKNDARDCNTSSIYLIGAGTAATLGIAWIVTEWNRPATAPGPAELLPAPRYEFVPQRIGGGIKVAAGEDISGAVWLSPQRPASIVSETLAKNWVAHPNYAPKMRDNNPMLFLYGDGDSIAQRDARFYFNEVLVGAGNRTLGLNPLNPKYLLPIKGAKNLSGVALLGNNATLKTEDTIVEFLAAIQKERARVAPRIRDFKAPWFIDLTYFGFTP
ncbi:MAG: lysophospholipase, partial [Gemmataceae bacterium]|nr:lysophospholipase [Gemmataceae bacterium]